MQQDRVEVASPAARLRRAIYQSAAIVVLLSVYLSLIDVHGVPLTFFRGQDRIVAVVIVAVLAACAAFGKYDPRRPALPDIGPGRVMFVCALLALLLWLGARLLLGGYAFTRDEQM